MEKLHSELLDYGGNKLFISVSDHLAPFYKAINIEAGKNAREKSYRYVWVANVRIFYRKNGLSSA